MDLKKPKKTNKHNIKTILEENKLLKEKYLLLKQKERIIRVINDFAASILQEKTLDDILWAIAKNAIAKLGFVDCVVYIVNEERQILIQKAAHGPKNPRDFEIINRIHVPIGDGIVGTVAQSGKAELIVDTSKDPRYIVDDAERLSEIAVPILLDGKVIAVIDSEHPEKGFYTEEHLQILNTIALMSASTIMAALTQKKLITYQNQLEEIVAERTKKLNKVIQELQISNKDLEQYASLASHDLKEPLRTISSFLQLIKQKKSNQADTETLEYINYSINAAQRMEALLNGLLEYAKVRSDQYSFSLVDLKEVLTDVIDSLSLRIQQSKAQISLPKNLPSLQGYKSLLNQLFQNLLTNAIKFTPADRAPKITINYFDKDSYHHFEVIDEGIGINPAYLEKVFELFSRLHSKKAYEGSGLGLSLCKRIVEMHGGQIRVKSEGENKGACFCFSLLKLEDSK